jgi:SAM-dependent methyltransferase
VRGFPTQSILGFVRVLEISSCLVCGRSDATEIADADDIRQEMESLWVMQGRRLRPGVPTERLMDRVTFSEDPPLRLVRCEECGLVYRNPADRRDAVTAAYAGDAIDRDTLGALHRTQLPFYRRATRRLLGVCPRPGRVLEVGSYVGAFLAAARKRGIAAEGLDINPTTNDFTRSLGFAVHDGDIQDAALPGAFDTVVVWNTFDQLADPRAALHRIRSLLNPGGAVVLRVPNGAFYAEHRLGGRFRTLALAHNNLLGFPYRFGFTPSSLRRLVEQVGFAATDTLGDTLVSTADEWTRPWARAEAAVIRAALRTTVARNPASAPWFELYART